LIYFCNFSNSSPHHSSPSHSSQAHLSYLHIPCHNLLNRPKLLLPC
jgi:hypothetical protein